MGDRLSAALPHYEVLQWCGSAAMQLQHRTPFMGVRVRRCMGQRDESEVLQVRQLSFVATCDE